MSWRESGALFPEWHGRSRQRSLKSTSWKRMGMLNRYTAPRSNSCTLQKVSRGHCTSRVSQSYHTPSRIEPTICTRPGAPLYITSSVFVRHTLNALYSDLRVDLLSVRTTPPPPSPSPSSSKRLGKSRDRSLSMRIGVSGLARVSGTKSEWEVDCTYGFSPVTGLILIHTVNSIHPAPHESVYEAFRLGFGRLGLGFNVEPRTGAQGTICEGSTPRKGDD